MRLFVVLVLLALSTLADAASVDGLRAEGRALFDRVARLQTTGVPIPPETLPVASMAVSASRSFSNEELDTIASRIRLLQAALTVLETEPSLAGAVELESDASYPAGNQVELALRYRPTQPLAPGAELIVDFHASAPGEPQNIDPEGRNFVNASTPNATIEATVDTVEAIAGSLEGDRYRAAFRVVDGTVPTGAPISIAFSRLELPTRVHGQYPIGLRTRFETGGYAYPVAPAMLALTPGPIDRISVHAPANVASGTRVPVTVRVEDRFGNLVAERVPPFDVLVDGNFETRTAAGEDPTPIAELSPLALGTHIVEVRSAGGGLRAEASVRSGASPDRIHWLEPHVATTTSRALSTEPEIRRHHLGRNDSVLIKELDKQLDRERWQSLPSAGVDGFVRAANIRAGGHALVLTNGPIGKDAAPRIRFPSGASLAELPDDVLVAALPEVPMDLRRRDPDRVRLVEILSGAAGHEWFGRQLAAAGTRIGFMGSSTAHDRGADISGGGARTAVRLRTGQSVFAALAAGQTWVTSGPPMVLDVTTNGAGPGERAAARVNRTIRGEVRGTAPIDRVELVRNGDVVAVRDFSHDADSTTFQVTLGSDSAPVASPDLPRNGREWIGFLRLRGGEITAVDDRNLQALPGQAAAANPASDARADFIVWTRGHPRSFYIDVDLPESVTGDGAELPDESSMISEFEIVLRRGREDQEVRPLYRQPAEIPPATLVIGLNELLSGPVTREYNVEGYADRVTLKRVNRDGPSRVNFEFLDRRVNGEGDYYYVRVVQQDDHVAISSPTFVGGFDPH